MSLLGRFSKYRRFVHHSVAAYDAGAAVTSLVFFMDNLVIGTGGVPNPGAPRAMKLSRIFSMNGCGAIHTAGAWTLRIRVNESGSDSATFPLTMAASPGSKETGAPSTQFVLLEGQSYHVVADGPSRNTAVCRAILEWEIL